MKRSMSILSGKQKLLAIGLTMSVAAVLLAAGTAAWLSQSVAPEASNFGVNLISDNDLLWISVDGENYDMQASLGEIFHKNYAPLNPVSTADGKHWFRPVYRTVTSSNAVREGSSATLVYETEVVSGEFKLVDQPQEHGNLPRIEKPEEPEKPSGSSQSGSSTGSAGSTATDSDAESETVEAYQAKLELYQERLGRYDPDASDASGQYALLYASYRQLLNEYQFFMGQNYFIYADIWLKSDIKGGSDVRLSVPRYIDGNYSVQPEEKTFGSFVLHYNIKKADGVETPVFSEGGPETAIRIGFLSDDSFRIYEPNADKRSAYQLQHRGTEASDAHSSAGKWHGFLEDSYYTTETGNSYSTDEYRDGSYLVTNPVRLNDEGKAELTPFADLKNSLVIQRKSGVMPGSTSLLEKTDSNPGMVLAQLSQSGALVKTGYSVNSTEVAMGEFVKDNSVVQTGLRNGVCSLEDDANISQAADNWIVHLDSNEPKKVRIIVWLEGQDPDCWNDIADGSIYLNLEFAMDYTKE